MPSLNKTMFKVAHYHWGLFKYRCTGLDSIDLENQLLAA